MKLESRDRQTFIRVGLLVVVPSVGIPWFGAVIGTGLGLLVGIFRALAGF